VRLNEARIDKKKVPRGKIYRWLGNSEGSKERFSFSYKLQIHQNMQDIPLWNRKYVARARAREKVRKISRGVPYGG